MDEPKENKLTIGGPRRREIKNIHFPNVFCVGVGIGGRGGTLVRLEGEVDHKGRTPLHNAAESGHLEAEKLLFEVNDYINAQARDSSGRGAIDLALDNNFYDVFNGLQD
ncbi:uncharacterized protein P174DRAFT_434760 [Aspergillus novofumigatus IBT 16806]|uniref:Uncharacterized protein n=1 Tax=Aspergillus novofumigatus (strain IBT 16806) TaxID=1392255 RepID=A0A2I1BYC3_ASPN1|nr:uncharacterized protein P174DRAFT_434760 [Aspergillus novofumigatus IBT 16806]PKX90377.1 hypothetical protein P174DRAFT_434760 [Aspergillus novofumigatus IBT 16806]